MILFNVTERLSMRSFAKLDLFPELTIGVRGDPKSLPWAIMPSRQGSTLLNILLTLRTQYGNNPLV